MTQKSRVLSLLRAAGSRGIRSDRFLEMHMPRAAARVLELREDGYEIAAEREKQFVRYTLRAGVGVGGSDGIGTDPGAQPEPSAPPSAEVSEQVPGGEPPCAPGDPARSGQLFEMPEKRRSIYDAWEAA